MAYSRCLIMKNKPRIRFKGFTEDWEQRKLGNLTQLITKGTTPKVKNIQNGINFIKVENISDDGVISINSYVSEEEHMNYLSRSILANNDILFSIAGTLGRTAIVKSHLLPANTNQALAIIRLNKSVDVEYINTFLKSNAIKTYIRKNPTVGAQPNLSLGQVSDLEINIPNYSEQKKVSNLFSKFDLMITLHQRKLEKLKLTKKALLQKLFPKNGSQFPEVRFKNFCDSWKPYKLGHYFKKYQNVIYLEDDVVYKQISVRNNGVIEYRCSTKGKDIGRKRQYIIDTMLYPDTLTFTRQTVYEGGIGFVPKTLDGAIVTENMPLLAMRNSNKDFMMALFNSQSYIFGVLNKNALSGSAQKALHERDWLNSVLLFPDIEEQNLIGRLINMIDKYIDLHYRKLDKLYGVKKSLLQKMFV